MEKNIKIVIWIGVIVIVALLFALYLSSKPSENKVTNVSIGNIEPLGEGNITIVEFSDFQCPACGRFEPTIKQLMEEYDGKVVLYYRNFPLTQLHKNAYNSALASLCADEQGEFWLYHDKLFENQDNLSILDLKKYAQELELNQSQFNICLDTEKYDSELQTDIKDGDNAGVRGTPTLFVNGREVFGAKDISFYREIIDGELKKN